MDTLRFSQTGVVRLPENPFGIPGLFVEARRLDDGGFEIEGQHLGAGAHVGREDYEYFHRVPPSGIPALAAALGCEPDDVLEAWERQKIEIVRHGEQRWLREHGVEHVTHVV